jgi:glycosyltransferase involved in cell wall biosynthesis
MKILVVSSMWPHGKHSIRAANIVIYEMLCAFAQTNEIQVGLLVVGNQNSTQNTDVEITGIDSLKQLGVDVLAPLVLPIGLPRRPRWMRLIYPRLVDKYPECAHQSSIANRVSEWGADAVLIPWSEWLTHACSGLSVLKFAYYGNPDPKGAQIQLRLRRRSGEIGVVRNFLEWVWIRIFEDLHLKKMKQFELLGNVAKNDADYYTQSGHPNAFYIQNIWMPSPIAVDKVPSAVDAPIRIIGSIGKVAGTANTLGLEFLGNELMPALDLLFKDRAYEVHILGAGKPHRLTLKAQIHPKVIWRGFVDNIDEEIRDCAVFLCVNNATEFKVGHTRFLHAWSLAAPVVAHQDASLSMPEIVNGSNALLGNSAVEIAEHIKRLVDDPVLCARIKTEGKRTFENNFTAERVVKTIIQKLQEAKV